MCVICEKGKVLKSANKNDKTSMYIRWEDCVPKLYLCQDSNWVKGNVYVEINYCPWCGRDLMK